ncbi:protein-tyrosine phosphatase domain-containing protein [Ditylenchus destructor]|uniref:Protein-tyrosine phosphatase domain-containing protein n=1 Tax=Ditylenchus destructor TaxID=166010 RepID=A0AAD4QWC4_9BILA|nr:protein-tyrosine phosphatase domain-containing protein [Ditylenchus destructor]
MANIKKENYARGHKKKSPTRHEKKAKSRPRTEEDGQNDDKRKQEDATERVCKGNYVPPKKDHRREIRLDDSQSARKPKVVTRNKEVQAKEKKPKSRHRDKDQPREHKVKDKKLTGFAKLFSFSEDASDGEGNPISVNKGRKPGYKEEFRRSRSKASSGNEEGSKNENKEGSEGEPGRERDARNSEQNAVIARKSKAVTPLNKASLVTAMPSRAVDIIFKRFAILTMGKGIHGLLQEFAALQAECPKPTPSQRVSFDRNREKNRYKDIYCWESSRVVLSWSPGGRQSDYIHANWVKGLASMSRKTICTQGPMAHTIADFWRMIWQEKCQGILMLCGVTENGKTKCEQYWPKSEGSETALGTTYEKATYIYLTIKNIGVKLKNEFEITKLALCGMQADGTIREHIVTHIQWAEWPDKSVPVSALGAIRAIGKTQEMSPLVVHCSAGVGRTGTIVIINAVLSMLVNGRDVKIYDVVKEIRSQRYNACQTDLQYLYIYRVILAYIVHMKIMSKVQLSKFIDDYTDLIEERNQARTTGQ